MVYVVQCIQLHCLAYSFEKRDYFWNLSRAILLARETIYIHDWWLSPGKILHASDTLSL